MPRIPKCQCVKETFWIGICELQCPVRSAIGGLVDARLVAGSAREKINGSLVHCMYAPEIKLFGAGNHGRSKGYSAIRGFEIRAASSARPDDFRIYGAHTSQRCGGSARMNCPRLRLRAAQKNEWYPSPHRL